MTSTPICRHCAAPLDLTLLDLGQIAASSSQIRLDKSDAPDPVFPLHLQVCQSCWLVQIDRDMPTDPMPASDCTCCSASFSGGGLSQPIVTDDVLTHIPGINDFVADVATRMTGDTVYSAEFPYLLRMIENVQLDTICCEHYFYLSLQALETVFAAHGLRVFDAEEFPAYGGSLRIRACRIEAPHADTPGLAAVRANEATARIASAESYHGYPERAEAVRDGLMAFLTGARVQGKTVLAYGAAARGNTLLNYCRIGPDLVACCVDRDPEKRDTLLPGSRIPVLDIGELQKRHPDFLLVLPGTHKADVIGQLADLRAGGTRFVTAVPAIAVTA